eukprot:g20338.t1
MRRLAGEEGQKLVREEHIEFFKQKMTYPQRMMLFTKYWNTTAKKDDRVHYIKKLIAILEKNAKTKVLARRIGGGAEILEDVKVDVGGEFVSYPEQWVAYFGKRTLLIREVFDIFDVTRSGAISTGELCGLLSAFNIDDIPAHVVLELHAKYDLDGNGSLDLEEFTQLVVSELSENGKLEELQLGKVEILTALKDRGWTSDDIFSLKAMFVSYYKMHDANSHKNNAQFSASGLVRPAKIGPVVVLEILEKVLPEEELDLMFVQDLVRTVLDLPDIEEDPGVNISFRATTGLSRSLSPSFTKEPSVLKSNAAPSPVAKRTRAGTRFSSRDTSKESSRLSLGDLFASMKGIGSTANLGGRGSSKSTPSSPVSGADRLNKFFKRKNEAKRKTVTAAGEGPRKSCFHPDYEREKAARMKRQSGVAGFSGSSTSGGKMIQSESEMKEMTRSPQPQPPDVLEKRGSRSGSKLSSKAGSKSKSNVRAGTMSVTSRDGSKRSSPSGGSKKSSTPESGDEGAPVVQPPPRAATYFEDVAMQVRGLTNLRAKSSAFRRQQREKQVQFAGKIKRSAWYTSAVLDKRAAAGGDGCESVEGGEQDVVGPLSPGARPMAHSRSAPAKDSILLRHQRSMQEKREKEMNRRKKWLSTTMTSSEQLLTTTVTGTTSASVAITTSTSTTTTRTVVGYQGRQVARPSASLPLTADVVRSWTESEAVRTSWTESEEDPEHLSVHFLHFLLVLAQFPQGSRLQIPYVYKRLTLEDIETCQCLFECFTKVADHASLNILDDGATTKMTSRSSTYVIQQKDVWTLLKTIDRTVTQNMAGPKKCADLFFQMYDVDGNRVLDFVEFLSMVEKVFRARTAKLTMGDLELVLTKKVERAASKAGVSAIPADQRSRVAELEDTFDNMPATESQTINADEFSPKLIKIIKQRKWRSRQVLALKNVFLCFDENGNETMDVVELKTTCKALQLMPDYESLGGSSKSGPSMDKHASVMRVNALQEELRKADVDDNRPIDWLLLVVLATVKEKEKQEKALSEMGGKVLPEGEMMTTTPRLVELIEQLNWDAKQLCQFLRIFTGFAVNDLVDNDLLASVLLKGNYDFDDEALRVAIEVADADSSGNLDFLEFLELIASTPDLFRHSKARERLLQEADDAQRIRAEKKLGLRDDNLHLLLYGLEAWKRVADGTCTDEVLQKQLTAERRANSKLGGGPRSGSKSSVAKMNPCSSVNNSKESAGQGLYGGAEFSGRPLNNRRSEQSTSKNENHPHFAADDNVNDVLSPNKKPRCSAALTLTSVSLSPSKLRLSSKFRAPSKRQKRILRTAERILLCLKRICTSTKKIRIQQGLQELFARYRHFLNYHSDHSCSSGGENDNKHPTLPATHLFGPYAKAFEKWMSSGRCSNDYRLLENRFPPDRCVENGKNSFSLPNYKLAGTTTSTSNDRSFFFTQPAKMYRKSDGEVESADIFACSLNLEEAVRKRVPGVSPSSSDARNDHLPPPVYLNENYAPLLRGEARAAGRKLQFDLDALENPHLNAHTNANELRTSAADDWLRLREQEFFAGRRAALAWQELSNGREEDEGVILGEMSLHYKNYAAVLQRYFPTLSEEERVDVACAYPQRLLHRLVLPPIRQGVVGQPQLALQQEHKHLPDQGQGQGSTWASPTIKQRKLRQKMARWEDDAT